MRVLISLLFIVFGATSCAVLETKSTPEFAWELVDAEGIPTARHEAAAVEFKGKIYLLGGRRINHIDVYDPQTNQWTQKGKTPIELHHFQAVVVEEAIYLIGAMTGGWPAETPLDRVLIYYPETDTFENGPVIPKERRRGGAGAVYHNGKIYIVGGITNGHLDGYVNWLDSYDVKTGEWQVLPDAPHRRDHFQAAVTDGKLYAFAGRRSEQRANLPFEQTVYAGDVFDIEKGVWEEGTPKTNIPTRRAGNFATAIGNLIIVGGGESSEQIEAHEEIEVFNTERQEWSRWPDLVQGRHGTGFAIIDGYLYTVSGCAHRGGDPELSTIERLKIPEHLLTESIVIQQHFDDVEATILPENSDNGVHKQWHTVELDFEGPQTSETAELNPFTDYRLLVEFTHEESNYLIRGFYAADGDAANTSATAGNVWRVRFSPDQVGKWSYKASLTTGAGIAVSRNVSDGQAVTLDNSSGEFEVFSSDAVGEDFRATDRGRLGFKGHNFYFENSGKYWLKGGSNSPENMLGYVGFDDTYRLKQESREGEASTVGGIHEFSPHRKDWKKGDPLWGLKTGKPRGHSLIGGINYLAEQGMNSLYFLTFNVTGDGNDVWPYQSPDVFDRFDVSKLDQWNVLFDHMQSKGVMLHVVTQERENELLLDDGNTEFLRSLYYSELISRFGHHPALVWNLGEENGPSSWDPQGQNDEQRFAMAKFFEENDPYKHPVLLHSHADAEDIKHVFEPLLGYKPLDGISLQIEQPERVYELTHAWRKLSEESGQSWLLSMDEIGTWYNGALPDDIDPDHDELRRHVLWGHLLAGGAGVEWYFGGKYHSNDVTVEDWRTRHNLWVQTNHAVEFFNTHIPFWKLTQCGDVMPREDVYCAKSTEDLYVFYIPGRGSSAIYLPEREYEYSIDWFDPKKGGELQKGSEASLGPEDNFVGFPPNVTTQDWVVLLRRRAQH